MRNRNLIGLLSAALALRLLLALVSSGASYDIDSYHIQAQAVLSGQNIYQVTYRYPYPPLWMYFPAVALRMSEWTNLPFYFWVKLPAIFADLGIGWLLFSWPLASSIDQDRRRAALYLFNPVPLLISAAHGQFDSVVIVFVLIAARLYVDRKNARSALSLSVAVALKGFPLLLLPAFLLGLASWGDILLYTTLTGSIFGLIILPYLADSGPRILGIVLNYNSTADHSYSYVLNSFPGGETTTAKQIFDILRSISRWLQVGISMIVAWIGFLRGQSIEWRVAFVFLAIYAVSPGLASQQMVWVIPFLILTLRWGSVWIYSAISSLALILFYGQYFPAVILLPSAVAGTTSAASRLIIETAWWLTVISILVATLFDRRIVTNEINSVTD